MTAHFKPFSTFEEFFAQAEKRPGYKAEMRRLRQDRRRLAKLGIVDDKRSSQEQHGS